MIKLPLFILSWILFLILRTIFIILGYIFVPISVLFKEYETRKSKIFPDKDILAFKSKLMWIWGNEEEGIGYYGKKGYSLRKRILYSECVRNPANNLRFVPLLSTKIDPDKVEFRGSLDKDTELIKYDLDETDFCSLTWQGLYSNFRYQGKIFGKRYRIWIGWKIYPHDKLGVDPKSHRSHSVGFATQFKRLR